MRPAEAASGEDVRACRYAAYRTRHATIDAALKPGGSIGTSMVGRLRGNSAPTVGVVNRPMKRKLCGFHEPNPCRHCERSEAIQFGSSAPDCFELDCFASLAM